MKFTVVVALVAIALCASVTTAAGSVHHCVIESCSGWCVRAAACRPPAAPPCCVGICCGRMWACMWRMVWTSTCYDVRVHDYHVLSLECMCFDATHGARSW